MDTVMSFEHMLVKFGIKLLKYYLDISQEEQKRWLEDRRNDPLKQWKVSPIDAEAVARWPDCSRARNEMLARTHNVLTPWTIVRADEKRAARLNLVKDLLARLHYGGKDGDVLAANPDVAFRYEETYVRNGMIAP